MPIPFMVNRLNVTLIEIYVIYMFALCDKCSHIKSVPKKAHRQKLLLHIINYREKLQDSVTIVLEKCSLV